MYTLQMIRFKRDVNCKNSVLRGNPYQSTTLWNAVTHVNVVERAFVESENNGKCHEADCDKEQ